jgi:hypothetical protein
MLNVARAGLLIQRGKYLASARILQTVAFAFPTETFPQAIAVLACNPRVHKAVLDDFVAKLGRALPNTLEFCTFTRTPHGFPYYLSALAMIRNEGLYI